MQNFIKALLWFLLLALVALFANYLFGDKACGLCNTASHTPNTEESIKPLEKVTEKLSKFTISAADGSTVFEFPDDFIINAQNAGVTFPEKMKHFKDEIYNYLNDNQGKELLITAKYLNSEGEPRGIDRAAFLKSLLVKAGVNANRIIPKAVLSEYSYDENEKYNKGIAMMFRNVSEDNIAAIEASITNKTLYAEFGAAEFKADRTLKGYAFELKNYLNKYPNKSVIVTGHTDSKGNAGANYNLGLKRAKQVVDFLISQGVAKVKIKSLSQGEKNPIATNDTDEGRAKNRRITIDVN